MKKPFLRLALLCVPAAILTYAAVVQLHLGPALGARDVQGITAFMAIALLSEIMAVDFRLGASGIQPRSSMAFLPFLGSIIVFAPHHSMLGVAGVVAFSQFVLRRNDLARASYNISQAALSAAVAGVYYHAFSGLAVPLAGLLSIMGAALLFFGTNILLASLGLSYLKNGGFVETLTQVIGPNGANLRYDLLATPIAIVPVLLYDTSPVLGVLVIVLPLLLINYSHVTKKEVIEANKDLLRALVKAIETRDPYTSGHSLRVASLAKAIAKDLKLSHRRIEMVEMAALLHDIGKIDPIYSEVLRKPFDLSPDERQLIQTHAARGAELLQGLRSVQPDVISAVLHHHERFDGNGYPAGISGDAIPIAARIIMLCDSVDAMLSDRPYRKALSLDHVHSELERCSGTQFDPEIVSVILANGTLGRAAGLVDRDSVETVIALAV